MGSFDVDPFVKPKESSPLPSRIQTARIFHCDRVTKQKPHFNKMPGSPYIVSRLRF